MAEDLIRIKKLNAAKIIKKSSFKVLTIEGISDILSFISGRYHFQIAYVMDDQFIFEEVYVFYKVNDEEYECEVISQLFKLLEPFLDVDESGKYPKIRFTREDVERVLLGKKVLATAQINRIFGREHAIIHAEIIND